MAEGDSRVEKENQKLQEFGQHTIINVRTIFDVPVCEERVENDSGYKVIYQGWAVVGSSESEAVWLISKLNYDSNGIFTERVWADGEDTFDKVWDNRATYNYSY
jgi:hypothetical protein